MRGIWMALMGTLFTFGVTTLGAGNVFFVRRDASRSLQSIFLGFAAGVMTAASVWSLLIPGIARAGELGQNGCLVAAAGFLVGVCLLLAADACLQKFSGITVRKRAAVLVMAVTVHNIPEGMAVGLAFALAAQHPGHAGLFSEAAALALGIGIQNYPEGMAVALPLIREGVRKRKAFLTGSMSAVVEPVFGVLAAAVSGAARGAMPFLLTFAAGTMIYVVVQELIPEARAGEGEKRGTLGFVIGFLLMMTLDIAVG